MPDLTLRGGNKKVIDRLPMVCMVCGDDADLTKSKTFTYTPPGAWAMFGLLGAVIASFFTKKMRVDLPLCHKHSNPWLMSNVATAALLGVLFGGLLIMAIFASALPDRDEKSIAIGILVVLWILGMILTGIAAGIASKRAITSVEIDDRRIRLANVCQEFIDVFKESEEEDEEERMPRKSMAKQSKRPPRDEDDDDDEKPRRTGIRRPDR